MEVLEDLMKIVEAYFSKEVVERVQEEELRGNLFRRLNNMQLRNYCPH